MNEFGSGSQDILPADTADPSCEEPHQGDLNLSCRL